MESAEIIRGLAQGMLDTKDISGKAKQLRRIREWKALRKLTCEMTTCSRRKGQTYSTSLVLFASNTHSDFVSAQALNNQNVQVSVLPITAYPHLNVYLLYFQTHRVVYSWQLTGYKNKNIHIEVKTNQYNYIHHNSYISSYQINVRT